MPNENRYFQYLAGERRGEILVFDKIEEDDGMVFVSFKDGSRCNEELIMPLGERNWTNQLMSEIEDPNNCWTFKEEWIGRQEEKKAKDADGVLQIVQPFIEGRKKVSPIPPKKVKSAFGKISSSTSKEGDKVQQEASNKVREDRKDDPVWLMMDKAKKFDTEVEMIMTIALPRKSLYDVAEESFENGGDKVIEYIIENLDDSKLKDNLKIALLDAYAEEEYNESSQRPEPPSPRLIKEGKKPRTAPPITEGSEKTNIKHVDSPRPKIAPAPQPGRTRTTGLTEGKTKTNVKQYPNGIPEKSTPPPQPGRTRTYQPEVVEEPIVGDPISSGGEIKKSKSNE